MYTPSVKKSEIERRWLLIDMDGLVLGRAASQIAAMLKGKHKAQYTPHADTGDHIVVVNAEKVRMTGRKGEAKMYYRHTGYPGGLVAKSADEVRASKPEDLIYNAVRRMLPRSPLGRQMMRKLRVYAGNEHPHVAQQPERFQLEY